MEKCIKYMSQKFKNCEKLKCKNKIDLALRFFKII